MSPISIGLRHEDKSRWERRTPITPDHVRRLKKDHDISVVVQPSPNRVFTDAEYEAAGALVHADLSGCRVIFGLKEIPPALFDKRKTYLFFSHTIKGQSHNMPMLQRLLDQQCTLLDYEKITDNEGRRLLFFGRYAGLAGMIDTLWTLGKRLQLEGIKTPFTHIGQAFHYRCLEDAEEHVRKTGEEIAREGLPASLGPLIVGFTGYGHVSQGAQEIFDLLPHEAIAPEDLQDFVEKGLWDHKKCYKVIYREEHMAGPIDDSADFMLQDYYDNPEKYQSIFEPHLQWLTVMVNAIYWDTPYPKLVTRDGLRRLFEKERRPRLRLIGDITCDIDGSVEPTVRATQPDNPFYTYDPFDETNTDGLSERGVAILPVDNFPCELPRESSIHFADGLYPFIPEIARADYSKPLDQLGFSPPLKHSTVVLDGKLTSDFDYLQQYLQDGK